MANIIGYTQIVCKGCGKTAVVRKYDTRVNKFCSNLCANKTNNPKKHTKCKIEGCGKPESRQGLCQMHAWRLKYHGDLSHTNRGRTCKVEGCEKKHVKNGFCSIHGQRFKRNGTTDDPVYLLDEKRYRQRKFPGHPLSGKNGRAFVHRVALFDEIGDGEHSCYWCGTSVRWDKVYPKDHDALIVDHLDHDRHNNEPSNLVPACNSCNSRRRRATIRQPLLIAPK